MEEMMDDALDMNEDEELEEEADAEVDKVLAELTDGKLGQAGAVGTGVPVSFSFYWLDSFAEILEANRTRQIGGRRNGKDDGAIPSATEWTAERLIRCLGSSLGHIIALLFPLCINRSVYLFQFFSCIFRCSCKLC